MDYLLSGVLINRLVEHGHHRSNQSVRFPDVVLQSYEIHELLVGWVYDTFSLNQFEKHLLILCFENEKFLNFVTQIFLSWRVLNHRTDLLPSIQLCNIRQHFWCTHDNYLLEFAILK